VIRRASWAYAACLLVLSTLLAWSIFAVPYLPTNDGPEHVLATHIETHYGDPGSIYRETLVPAPEYAARGFSLLYGPLSDGFGWRLGLQLALVVIVLASAWGFVALIRAVNPQRLGVAFLGFPLALTWVLYMGFFPFAFGSAVGLFVLALAVGWREPSRSQRCLLAFLLLLQAVSHVFSAVLTGAVVGFVLVMRAPRRGRLAELAKVALMGLPAACVLFAAVVFGGSLLKSPFSDGYLVLPVRETLAVLPRLVAPGPWWRAIAFTLLVGVAAVVGCARLRRHEAGGGDRALLVAGMVLLLATAASPLHIPGWQFFSPRFAPLGALLCLVTVPLERASPRSRFAVSAALFVVSASSLLASRGLHRRLAMSCADAIAGLSAPVRRRALWLPVTLAPQGALQTDGSEREVPFLDPLRHMPSLYAVALGGLTPYTFANNAATYPFVVRADGRKAPPIPPVERYSDEIESDVFDRDARFRRRVEDELATYAMFYEGVLVTGARPADLTLWRSRGYVADWEDASVLVGHFVPCPLEVRLPGAGPLPRVDVGVGTQTILRDETPEPKADVDGSRLLQLPRSPCGDVWVRPHWDRPRSDGTHERRFCQDTGPTGEIRAALTWTAATVRCDPANP
jgi:hypothetical protein